MTDYLLRDIPDDVWRKAKARAALEGTSLRDALLTLLTKYGKGRPVKDRQHGKQ